MNRFAGGVKAPKATLIREVGTGATLGWEGESKFPLSNE